jgi:hypothetical protein
MPVGPRTVKPAIATRIRNFGGVRWCSKGLGSGTGVAAEDRGQIGEALPFLAAVDGVLDLAHPLRG